MTGDHGTIDFGKKIATIEGKVRLLQYQEKKDDDTKTNEADKKQSDDDNSLDAASHSPAEMTCDKIVYNYRTKQAVFTGHLVITQKSRTITADHGTYDATKKIATLGGDVVDKEKDGGVLKTDKATASLKKGDEWVDIPGPHSYDFTPSDEDNPRPK
jgi:lipopolysaccharide assembly outer membrane protein LptD (OstA)